MQQTYLDKKRLQVQRNTLWKIRCLQQPVCVWKKLFNNLEKVDFESIRVKKDS